MRDRARTRIRIASSGFAFVLLWLIVLCVGGVESSYAQGVLQPSPEQMQMLNQLPPEQRQQALEALRNFQEQQRQLQAERQQLRGMPEAEAGDGTMVPGGMFQAPLLQAEEVPTAEGGSSVIITLTPREDLAPEERARIETDQVLSTIRGSHYYELNDFGVLEDRKSVV